MEFVYVVNTTGKNLVKTYLIVKAWILD